jgi:predicted nuclease of predicted toxin-antitoxin system
MARLLADENFPLPVVAELRRLGHDVLTMHEAALANQQIADEAVLVFAISHSRAVLTLNRKHFVRLHNTGAKHAGIIVCTFDIDFERQARRIDDVLRSGAEFEGQLLRVNRPAV